MCVGLVNVLSLGVVRGVCNDGTLVRLLLDTMSAIEADNWSLEDACAHEVLGRLHKMDRANLREMWRACEWIEGEPDMEASAEDLCSRVVETAHKLWRESELKCNFCSPGKSKRPPGAKPALGVRYDSFEGIWLDDAGAKVITREEKRGQKRARGDTPEEDELPSDASQAAFLASCVRSQILFEPGSFLGLRITATELTQMDAAAFSLLMARIDAMMAQAAQWNAARSPKNARSVPALSAENKAPEDGDAAATS
jgi:hypothetical protein